jgi:FkbM family methyltransferase
MLLNTFAGNILLAARDKFEIVRAALLNPESVGMLANDQLATELVTKMCRPGKLFVDVGAHIGSIISKVQQHDQSIEIIAIEAIPEKIENLRRKFQNVKFHNCAAGESESEASFFINTKQSGYSSLNQPGSAESNIIQEIKVSIKKLDDLLPSEDIDVIKIDVEGAELGVVRGGEDVLSANRPVIMFESASMDEGDLGYTKEGLWQWFADHEYQVLIPNRVAHNDDGLSQKSFIDSHVYPRRTTNYFAVPKERRTESRDRARDVLGIPAPD